MKLCSLLAVLAAGCSGGVSPGSAGGVTPPVGGDGSAKSPPIGKYIKHVVIIIQENRSFDNIFAGYPGADTAMSGKNSKGKVVDLKAIPFHINGPQDMNHNFAQSLTAWDNGKMDKFDLTPFDSGEPNNGFAYAYLERSEVAPYWELANEYVLADHIFPMEFGPSFTSHLGLVAGTDNLNNDDDLAEANYPFNEPWGCDQQPPSATTTVNKDRVLNYDGPPPCFTQFRTLADVLDEKHISWRYYAPPVAGDTGGQLWSTFDAIKNIRYGPDWAKNVLTGCPQTIVLTDAAKGKLQSVSWVIPDWADSDHPAANLDTGPSWVSSVVNAIGKGPDWNTTAIFLIWDDWGGWFDNVPPPQHDFRGNGIRTPMLVISPYARKGYVDHDVYETGSILRFIEQTFGLPTIGTEPHGYTDARALSPINSFDFTQKPRKFVPLATKYPESYFFHHKPSLRPPDNDL